MEYSTEDALTWLTEGINELEKLNKQDDQTTNYAIGFDLGFLYGTLRTLLATGNITRSKYEEIHASLTKVRQRLFE